MFGCKAECPNCRHVFQCCQPARPVPVPAPAPPCCCAASRRSLRALSGGGLVAPAAPATPSSPISPSAPLAFILPSLPPAAPLKPAPDAFPKPETELERLADTERALRLSGWYYEGLAYQQSHELLKSSPAGTFLVRNSSNPRFLYSLSVQTERGPTSVRLHYGNGYFRLDAQPHLQSVMPVFPGVIELVQHYVEQSRLCKSSAQVWVDPNGKWYSSILLERPLRKRSEPPSLKHMARLAVHKALDKATPWPARLAMSASPLARLELPGSLATYLADYKYPL